MEFYYHDGYHTHGPFKIEELLKKDINLNSWINVRGTKDWVKASEVEALRGKIQPPLKKRNLSQSLIGRKKKQSISKVQLDHEAVKKQIEASYIKEKEKVEIQIIDLNSRKEIKEYLVPSIISLFGIFILGIIAIIKSSGIKKLIFTDNIVEAKKLSILTKKLSFCGIYFFYGILLWMITIIGFYGSMESIFQSIDRPNHFYYY